MHGLPGKCANLTPEWGVTQVSDSRSASPREGGTSIVWADTAVSASYGDVSFRDLFNPAEGDSRQRLHCTDHIKRPGQLHKLECRRRLARGRNRGTATGRTWATRPILSARQPGAGRSRPHRSQCTYVSTSDAEARQALGGPITGRQAHTGPSAASPGLPPASTQNATRAGVCGERTTRSLRRRTTSAAPGAGAGLTPMAIPT